MDDNIFQNALRLRRAGKFDEAAALYGDILLTEPKHFEALHALGIVRYQCGQLEEAERLIGQAIAVRPSAADALYNRASLLWRLNRLDEALTCFDRAIAEKPDYIEALTNRGIVLTGLGRFGAALADFDKVLALRPGSAHAWRHRGMALEALNRPEEALASLTRASELDPADATAHLKRANQLLNLNRAGEAELAYGKYLAIVPNDPEAWNHRGIAAATLKRKDDALECFGRAVALAPGDADFWNNRANALFEMKRYSEAAAAFGNALAIAPDLPFTEGYRIQSQLRCCDWHELAQNRRKLSEGLAAGRRVVDPLSNLALSRSPAEQLKCARLWIADGYAQPHPPFWQGKPYRHDRIRVAYLSADFRLHPVAFLIAGVFEHHDRRRFETIGVSFTPPGETPMRMRIEKACDRFYDVRERTDDDTASLLRQLEVDIAIDLMGFTDGARTGIFALRPAPVQVNYLGYPGTMGADYMDYILGDRFVIPEIDRRHYSEQVVYLPDCYLPNDSKRAIATRTMTRAEVGLPDKAFVFSSFNDGYKITPDVFDVWMRLLKAVEGSIFWLPQFNAVAMANLRREAQTRGVTPERLVFASYLPAAEDHLARLSHADLFLDTLVYNAHAGSCDALWTGLPMITCPGETFAGRVAASALNAVGLPELVANSLETYEALALKLARDASALAAVKAKLAGNRGTFPLFDTARFTLHLEAAYTAMWERTQRGEPPASFAVQREPALRP